MKPILFVIFLIVFPILLGMVMVESYIRLLLMPLFGKTIFNRMYSLEIYDYLFTKIIL